MAPSLCENCRKRPKFGAHRFCGKTCATQAAAKPVRPKQSQSQARAAGRQRGPPPAQLCIYCGQKPKFNNFDYCGKSCAALANAAQTRPPATQTVPATKQKTAGMANAPNNKSGAQGQTSARAPKVSRTKATVPQTNDSTEESEEKEDSDVSTDLDVYPSDSGSESEDEANAPAKPVSQPGAKGTSKGGKPSSRVAGVAPGACAIPGCDQPSHVDRSGVKTKYCSTKHREEAVKLGLEAACIMCSRYPQSSSDYFCSSACRNQSMTKT